MEFMVSSLSCRGRDDRSQTGSRGCRRDASGGIPNQTLIRPTGPRGQAGEASGQADQRCSPSASLLSCRRLALTRPESDVSAFPSPPRSDNGDATSAERWFLPADDDRLVPAQRPLESLITVVALFGVQ